MSLPLDKIGWFSGPFRWLSNFYPAPVSLSGVEYPTVEHAFQAAKTLDDEERATVLSESSPGKAKRVGQTVTLRTDWDDVKLDVMEDLVRQKFSGSAELKEKLLETEGVDLEEGNTWGDTYWGTVDGVGQNHLGTILMNIRTELSGS
jgi:ribA/ribD-fused uncharacterized protein